MSEIGEEEIARVVRQAMLSNPDGGPFRHRESERSLIASEAARQILALLHPALGRAPEVWRHKKRGGLYEIVGEAQIQTSHPLEDYELVVVYRSLNTPDIDDPKSPMKGELWARPKAEFYDGRFEAAAIRKGPGE